MDFCLGGARRARGTAVVIDVFRAFSTAAYAFAGGAAAIYPVDGVAAALAMKAADPELLLMGETQGRRPEGFDLGNSPTEIMGLAAGGLSGRRIVQATSAGTRGLVVAAAAAENVLAASFVTAGATLRLLAARQPEIVNLVCLGAAAEERSPEDDMCGIFLKNALEDYPNHFEAIARYLRGVESAKPFFDPAADWAPENDFELCLAFDRFDFALVAGHDADGRLCLVAEAI
jgi:2-phosphosulfolactate phosphatase